ncbi:MAG: hypothetical protein RID11_06065 [Roseovarius sp.]
MVDSLFGNSAAGLYQSFVAYSILVGGLATIGIPYAALSISVDQKEKALDLLVFAFFCTLVGVTLCLLAQFIFDGSIILLFCWWPFAVYQIFAARMKMSNNVLSSITCENLAPYATYLTIVMWLILYNASDTMDQTAFADMFRQAAGTLLLIISAALLIAFLIFFRSHLLSWKEEPRFLLHTMSTRAKYNFGTLLSSLPFNKVELFIFAYLGMLNEAGWFAKALVLANIASMPLNFSASLFVPNFIAALREKNLMKSNGVFLKYRRSTFYLTIAVSLFAILVGNVYFYTRGELNTYLALTIIIICTGNLVTASVGHFHYALIAIGREKECTKANFVALAANIFVALILIPIYAEVGAALSIFVAHVTKSFIGALYMRTYLRHG